MVTESIKWSSVAGNPEMRTYHVRLEMVEETVDCKRGTATESSVAELLLSLKGIEALRLAPYHAIVMKAPMFAWDEVHPKVVEVMESMRFVEQFQIREESTCQQT